MYPIYRTIVVLFAISSAIAWCGDSQPHDAVVGSIGNDQGPVAGVRVGWQGDKARVTTNPQGRFHLPPSAKSKRIIVSKPGYRIASVLADGKPVTLRLERLPMDDNPDYEWIDPHADPKAPNNCANCHVEIHREWQASAHAKSATNPKFLSLFDGDRGKHKTWNAQAEHPDGSAVCASCHAPTLRSPKLDYDIRVAKGADKSGVHCDYCHKVADAPTDKLGIRFGRDGLMLLRPAKGELLTFGPLDDAVRPGESFGCLPVYKESRYCASCHEGIIFGVHAYATYSEWLDSPAKKANKQCQDCHMAPTGKMTNIAPMKGGIERDPMTLASHHTPGASLEMLRQCLTLKADVKGKRVAVEVIAKNVGHRVPTGFPDRQLVLVVKAVDGMGKRVALSEGSRLPANAGKWKDSPGVLYAKQLIGEKNRTPLPFWLPIIKLEDTRLLPEQPDRRTFEFAAVPTRVTVQLWYRRFWQETADSRGWTDNDLLVHARESRTE